MSIDLTPKRCADCPYRGKCVPPSGLFNASMVIVGESPGGDEVRAGQPFIGPSGSILWNALADVQDGCGVEKSKQITRDDFLVMNAFKCRPTNKEDTKRFESAIHACRSTVWANLLSFIGEKKIVFALGNAALWTLTGDFGLKITQARGQLFDLDQRFIDEWRLAEDVKEDVKEDLRLPKVLPLIHPAALMRGTGSIRQFKDDLEYGLKVAGILQDRSERFVPPEEEIIICGQPKDLLPLMSAEYIAADIETSGLSYLENRILSLGLQAIGDNKVFIIPWDFDVATTVGREFHFILADLLEDPKKRFIWHNGKFDVKFLRSSGIRAHVHEDTMLMYYSL